MKACYAVADRNKRLALTGVIAFYGVNGRCLTLINGEAYDLVMAVAGGTLDIVGEVGTRLGNQPS